MTPALLLARDFIICWVNAWLAPVECAFDMIESELRQRRGRAMKQALQRTSDESFCIALTKLQSRIQ